ncbi:MAG: nucleotide sugar dehydrogenase, partial [Rhodospirillaceae bacterium]|nr:nucleotide sugar dehydrogenase [Rhodospirillaceae bacterium]
MSSTVPIAVIGLGYVGLPLAVALARHFPTIGYDVDRSRIGELKTGHDRTGEIDAPTMSDSALSLTVDAAEIANAEIYIVTVPTPVDDENQPDLRLVEAACAAIGAMLK